jgi:hypothetical protein
VGWEAPEDQIEMEVMHLQSQEASWMAEATSCWQRLLDQTLPQASRRRQPCRNPDLCLPTSRPVRQCISIDQATQIVVICYGSHRKQMLIHEEGKQSMENQA